MLQEGDKVPASLKASIVATAETSDSNLKPRPLKELYKEQPLILFFYPKDMTPGCTTEARAFAAAYEQIQKLGVQVVGCSRDNITSHCKFMSKNELPYALISDNEGDISETFGVWQEKKMYGKTYMGIVRSTFIIDKGKIIKSFPKVKPASHVEEVLAFIKQ